jgi:hypothetical protein
LRPSGNRACWEKVHRERAGVARGRNRQCS